MGLGVKLGSALLPGAGVSARIQEREEVQMGVESRAVGEAVLWSIRRLQPGDEERLARFYNGLSRASRRTFRPLGWETDSTQCAEIVRENQEGSKYDLVVVTGSEEGAEIVGWSFVWDLWSEKPSFGLGIADAYQGRGLGGTIMGQVLADVCAAGVGRVYLTVVQDNYVAYGMYGRRGFVRYGETLGEDGLAYYKMVADLHG
jgi:ribosomal protein S18 acetylase RimI-like enzyme